MYTASSPRKEPSSTSIPVPCPPICPQLVTKQTLAIRKQTPVVSETGRPFFMGGNLQSVEAGPGRKGPTKSTDETPME